MSASAFEKALWVVRDRIVSREACDDLLADAVERGIRQLVVQVRGRGDAYFSGGIEPRAETLDDPAFDPLEHLVRSGAVVGARIHAWANVYFVWSHPERSLPRDPRHLVRAHPEWLLRPDGVHYLDPVGGGDWEGIYADPAKRQPMLHTIAVAADIAARYRVEGIHWDYVRYPQARYAASPGDHEHVTTFVREAARWLRRMRPDLTISAAVFPDPQVARDLVLQRWPEWARERLVDLLCPMSYRRETREVARILAAARAAAPDTTMWGGLMAYADAPELVTEQVAAARDAGCDGTILFAYDPARRDILDRFASA